MTIKLNDIKRWCLLTGENALVLEGTRERRVRLHFNVSDGTRVYLLQPDGQRFLAFIQPGDVRTLEFSASGILRIVADAPVGSQVWMHTAETEPTYLEVPDPVIFTELAQRRHRNPELEEIMYRMQVNIERRLNQQAEEHQAAIARIARRNDDAKPAPVAKPAGTADAAGGDEVQPPKPAAGKPGEKAGSKAAGEQPGGGADPAPAGK